MAITVHVAEILRDAGPNVMLCPRIDSDILTSTLLYRVNMCRRLPDLPRLIIENWVSIKDNFTLSIIIIMLTARILRLLATNYMFTEVSPDVFANNRLSSVLDTGKSVEELLAKLVPSLLTNNHTLRIVSPESKHIGTSGMTSILEYGYEWPIGLFYSIRS